MRRGKIIVKLKKLLEKVKKSPKKLKIVLGIVSIVLIIGIVYFCLYNNEAEVDTTYIIARLEKSSELTTAKLNYTGMSEFKDSGISFINRSDFIMVYSATARAGIDVKEIQIDTDKISKIVWLTIPKAKVLDVKVDMNSIKYFDEKLALFNVDYKEDANKANALAEEEAIKELASMGILEMADTQAEALIKGLIEDLVPENYEIQVKK